MDIMLQLKPANQAWNASATFLFFLSFFLFFSSFQLFFFFGNSLPVRDRVTPPPPPR